MAMKTITIDEINKIYKDCGLSASNGRTVRTSINAGTLNKKLYSNYDFMDKSLMNCLKREFI